jgi:peptide/nickel transport system permease protein
MTTQSTTSSDVVSLEDRKEGMGSGLSLTQLAVRRLRKDYLTLGAMAMLLFLALSSFAAPLITDTYGGDYRLTDPRNRYEPLGAEGHPLGTDHLGRDHLARLLYAGQISIGIAFVAGICSTFLGISIGLIAGFYQGGQFGFIDDIIMWFITTLTSIPSLVLLILISAVARPSITILIFSLVLISWSGTMRLVRGETISQRAREYILSATAIGARPIRLMFVHILPNVFSVFIIALALEIGTLILVEAALSFIGLGVRPPTPSWGNMLTFAQSSFRVAPFLSIFPGLLIVATVLSLYLIGDGLRDAFDPQSTRQR